MKKPTIEEIKDRYQAYKKYYGTLHDQQREMDNYYELVYTADVPTNYPTRMPPTARNWVDVGVRHFTLDNPKSKVFLKRNSEPAREQVSLLETFYNFWLRKDILTIKDAAKKLLLRGEVFLKVVMDDSYLGQDNEDRLFHFPLSLTVPDPINVFASPAHNGLVPVDVIECFNITVAEAQDICSRNGWKWETEKAPDKHVEWFSFYNDQWRCFMLDEEPVLSPEVQANLDFCSYVHIGAGQGQSNYEGKPEYLYRSLLWPLRDMLKMEVRVLSSADAINARYAWPRYKAKLSAASTDIIKTLYPDGNVPTDPDKWLYEVADQLEISIQQGEQPPAGLFEQYAILQAQAQPPAVSSGHRPPGVYSGEHQAALMAGAKTIYKDPFKNLEDGLGIAMGMGARKIEKVYKYSVEIKNFASEDSRQYAKLTPDIIGGHYDCEVQLLAEPPEATDMRKALGKTLRQGGSISQLTELRQYHDMSQKEADDEMAQQFAELAMKEMAVREVLAKDAMERLGMTKELAAIEEAERVEKQKLVASRPPIRQGEGLNLDIQRRGRESPELGAIPTPTEMEVT